MVRSRLDPDHLVTIRFLRLDPLRVRRQREGNGEDNGFLHAQVSTDPCIAPKTPDTVASRKVGPDQMASTLPGPTPPQFVLLTFDIDMRYDRIDGKAHRNLAGD